MNFGILPASWSPPLLSVLRIMAGLLYLAHGTSKLLLFPQMEMMKDGVPLFSLFGVAGVIEIIGGILITLGLFTRVVAFIVSGELAVAYFMFHAPNSFFPLVNRGEAAVLFCFIFLYMAAAGPGPWSIDAKRG